MEPKIGLNAKARKAVVAELSALLANEAALAAATRGAHWNVVGVHFGPLHALFGQQYEALNDTIDEIAERIRTLGGAPESRLADFAKRATIDDRAGDAKTATAMLASLLAAHEAVIAQLRSKTIEAADEADDDATEDFLIGLLASHEKAAWFLRAHLS
jgi:starvation-inducible DNA-binding protein